METVGTGFGDDIDDTAAGAAELRVVIICLYAEFLYGVRIRDDVARITEHRHVDSAVQIIANRSGAAVHAPVDQGALLGITQHDAILRRLNAGSQLQQRVDVPVDDGQADNFGILDQPSNRDIFGVYQRCGRFHAYDLRHRSDLQRGVRAARLVHVEHNSRLHELLEPVRRNFERIIADGQKFDPIFAVTIGLRASREPGVLVRGGSLSAGHRCPSGISHLTEERCGGNLCSRCRLRRDSKHASG
jgi:hypothetical protein